MRAFHDIFSHSEEIEPSRHLRLQIMTEIGKRELRRERLMLASSLFGGCASAVTLVEALKYSAGAIAGSGFSEYLSLIFSDGGSLVAYWKEFLISLVESLPLLGITLVVASVLALLVSLRGTFTYSHHQHARLA
jgi:hypothetical protein